MCANVYMAEAEYLAAAVPRNRCPSTDALDVLDARPWLRLALEDSWTDPGGRVYREVPAERVSRWPGHISRTFKSFLRISRDPSQVFELLDLLNELDAGPDMVRSTLAGCRRRSSLAPAITYYRHLAEELRAVTGTPDPLVEVPATREPQCRPRFALGEVQEGTWFLRERPGELTEDGYRVSPSHRAMLLHDPGSAQSQPSWIQQQSPAFKRLFYSIRRAKERDLQHFKRTLQSLTAEEFSRDQLVVLWDAYRIRRDFLWKRREQMVKEQLGITARKLIKRIERIQSRSDLGHVGSCLYKSSKGEIKLPGSVSQPEWAVVFKAYRDHKAALVAPAQ